MFAWPLTAAQCSGELPSPSTCEIMNKFPHIILMELDTGSAHLLGIALARLQQLADRRRITGISRVAHGQLCCALHKLFREFSLEGGRGGVWGKEGGKLLEAARGVKLGRCAVKKEGT